MKKSKAICCLGLAVCMIGCSGDDEDLTTATIPFTLTASLSQRSADSEDTGLLQGAWNSGDQLAVMKTATSGVKKGIFTYSSTTTSTFSSTLSASVQDGNQIAVFYPAEAITAVTSDTLTQVLSLSGQDGTLAGIAAYDYSWAVCTADVEGQSGAAECDMTNLMSIGKFRFTTDGSTPLNNISSIMVAATSGTLYSKATVKLSDGGFSSTTEGSITVKNASGISGTTYISFFPSEAQLHFTLVTTDGVVYETSTPETVTLEKGAVQTFDALTCTVADPAHVGDYYYSDGSFSTVRDEYKTCIGIVYALNDADGNIDRSLSESPFGRVVALFDNRTSIRWMTAPDDMDGLENYANADGSHTLGYLPYYNGDANAFFADTVQITTAMIDAGTGLITSWPSQGAISDFDGEGNTSYINSGIGTYPAGTYCTTYSKEGKGAGDWYLPAAGDLALLWELQKSGVICHEKQDCFFDFREGFYWSSTECSEERAWYVNFLSGTITSNYKTSAYTTRAVTKF